MGAYLGAVAVFMVVLICLADGSLLARLGRMVEDEVGDELRTTTGTTYGRTALLLLIIIAVRPPNEGYDH